MLFLFPVPLIYIRGRRYMHTSVGECVDQAEGSYWVPSFITLGLILWERSLSEPAAYTVWTRQEVRKPKWVWSLPINSEVPSNHRTAESIPVSSRIMGCWSSNCDPHIGVSSSLHYWALPPIKLDQSIRRERLVTKSSKLSTHNLKIENPKQFQNLKLFNIVLTL